MKLSDKIITLRKQTGLSQEMLAQQVGVSRQAVSKWETGDAVPEIGKLLLLAKTFGVTTDWLLGEDEELIRPKSDFSQPHSSSWVDQVPGMIGKLLKRYGWLAGVYIAVAGAGFAGMGTIAKYMIKQMLGSRVTNFFGQDVLFDGFVVDVVTKNPVTIFGNIVQIVGFVMIIVGVVLAVVLKKKSNEVTI